MSLAFDVRQHCWVSDQQAGPAGTCGAYLGSGVYATVDLATGELLSVECIARRRWEQMDAVLTKVIETPAAVNAVRRLAFAQTLAADDETAREPWYALDRLWAKIDLQQAARRFDVGFDDPDLDEVIAALRADINVRSARNAAMLDQAFEALERFTSQPGHFGRKPGTTATAPTLDLNLASRLPTEVLPNLVVLSHGVDLGMALGPDEPHSGRYTDGVLAIFVPINDPDRWSPLIDCYLVEPNLDEPVSAIGRFVRHDDQSMVVTLPVRAVRDWSDSELVLIPSGAMLKAKQLRPIEMAEVGQRTAVRLAQKGRQRSALEKARWAADVLRAASAPPERIQRADDLVATIERSELESGLLADS